jgi:8-oxo-dGTP pyrophosphatase MutT (NUDIX family)
MEGADGIRWRNAARIIVLDGEGRALLVRGHDGDNESRSWWFTVGGGTEPGETLAQTAVRELDEETGISVLEDQLIGPVVNRVALFEFASETVRQVETFYAVVVPKTTFDPEAASDYSTRWLGLESELLDELAWLSAEELLNQNLEYFPQELPDIIRLLSSDQWDGLPIELGLQDDDDGR